MAVVKVSELPVVTSVTADDYLIVNDGNATTSTVTWAHVIDTIEASSLTITGSTTFTGAVAVNGTLSGVDLGELDNVTITSPSAGQVLEWNGSAWVNAADTGATSLTDLSDVDLTVAPVEGSILVYDSSNLVFEAQTPAVTRDGSIVKTRDANIGFQLRDAGDVVRLALGADGAATFAGTVDVGSLTTSGVADVGSLTSSGDVAFDTDKFFFKSSNGRVGLGTTAPNGRLHVKTAGGIAARFERETGSSALVVKNNSSDDGMTIQGSANSINSIRLEGYGNNVGIRFCENDGGTVTDLMHVKSSGIDMDKDVTFKPSSSVTPAANGDLMIEATNDTTLTFKFKGSDGTVRTGTLTLS